MISLIHRRISSLSMEGYRSFNGFMTEVGATMSGHLHLSRSGVDRGFELSSDLW